MSLKDALIKAINEPESLRQLFSSPELVQKLENAGIEVTIYELHEPAPSAKKAFGLGKTLCGRDRGMRNKFVTCKKCLAKMEKLKRDVEDRIRKAEWDKIFDIERQ